MKIITMYSIYLTLPESEVPNSTAQWKKKKHDSYSEHSVLELQ